jgi:3-carboxy-cis,cis-muconate cycloisomerase
VTTEPFSLLLALFGDEEMSSTFSEESTVAAWLRAEAALAGAQQDVGVLSAAEAGAIQAAAVMDNVDLDALRRGAANVGYPILPLVRMIDAAVAPEGRGRVHLGATTQDIMDTGLSLQLAEALDRLKSLLLELGDALAGRVLETADTPMAARTHAQQAVPTTFGAKLAVFLTECERHLARIEEVRPRATLVSLYGAGGTSASFGELGAATRRAMAARLGLVADDVPWHVARDGLAELGLACALVCGTCARLAREMIDLSRDEIGEVAEEEGHHRGASSTMPQKANPITSEGIVGLATVAQGLTAPLLRAMEAEHERAAGEWQVEWHVLPQLAVLAASVLQAAGRLVRGLRIDPGAMRANLAAGGGLLMAEAYMMRLAPMLGRERAHDLVYEAARTARRQQVPLADALAVVAAEAGLDPDAATPIAPEEYLGQASLTCNTAVERWRRRASA